jgi:hypothetical protein
MIGMERLIDLVPSRPDGEDVREPERPRRTLISDGPWDEYRPQSLLPLRDTYRENVDLGFVLRHYWVPATVLAFRQSCRVRLPDGREGWAELEIERTIARCRANECLWRERVRPAGGVNGRAVEGKPAPLLSEALCSYDCCEHTYASGAPILFKPPGPEDRLAARRAALYRLPILVPPWPVTIGLAWYAKVEQDYMNYRLAGEDHVGETSVLVIRREGRYSVRYRERPAPGADGAGPVALAVRRSGVTVFAWNRGTVLEDRVVDCVAAAEGALAPYVGTTGRVVTRLMRSSPPDRESRLPL